MNKSVYITLLASATIATIAGLLTLMPWATANYPNILGYRSLCTFAPAAAFYCFLIAGIICFCRATFTKDRHGTLGQRFIYHRKHLLPLVIVLIVALVFTFWHISVKRQYTDATTTATPKTE
jgi:hypothetical protein